MPAKKRSDSRELARLRNQTVLKSNELIQKRTHMLSVQEQKIILFLIAQLTKDQKEFEYQSFDIIDFCDACGINHSSGKNYDDLRKAIKSLSDKSMWVIGEDNDVLMRWISNAKIEKGSGKILIRFDEEMKPFLLELKDKFTKFDLIYTITMRSKYSIRLYELLKSYEAKNEPVIFGLARFKETIGTEYERWVDIRRFVIEPAIKEINRLTDLSVFYTTKKKGKSISEVTFILRAKRSDDEKIATFREIHKMLDKEPVVPLKGQLMLDGGIVE